MLESLTIDNVRYRVRVVFGSVERSFEILQGENTGRSLTGREIRDIIGTNVSYSMQIEPHPSYPEDYDNLFDVLASPVESHVVTLPYGQTTMTFDAAIESGSDRLGATYRGISRWNGMQVYFHPIEPQK